MEFSTLLLQAASGGGMVQLVFFGAMLLIFWLFLIRPQAKRQREQGEFMKNLAKGDDVVTASGIIGKINKIEDKTIVLEVGKVFIPFTRSAISKEMTDAFFNEATKN
ncbi:preprotein translocase subunit YajC [Lewinella sp. LCG006]|uniref:preprotein translocase subunit YajC n=1 Tax=Lewinella sp. LCG006 TaxID=3231911 RepID=UPI003460A758